MTFGRGRKLDQKKTGYKSEIQLILSNGFSKINGANRFSQIRPERL